MAHMASQCSARSGMRLHKLAKLSLAAILCIVVLVGYQSWQSGKMLASEIIELPCNELAFGCGNASLQIKSDHTPQVMKPFNLHVNSSPANSVYVDFAMAGMSMGLNRYRLIQQADGQWHGDIILPVCVQGRSDWLMEVTVSTGEEEKRYHLPFQAIK